MTSIQARCTDSPDIRRAGHDALSLSLMDSRNRSLRWLALFDDAVLPAASTEFDPPHWLLGHVGWFQESWIARNVQRQRGTRCDPRVIRLASLEPQADRLYERLSDGEVAGDAATAARLQRWKMPLPDSQALRRYLADTIEVTLELLESADDSDDALYFYRLALFHEDLCAETFAEAAQAFGVRAAGALLPGAASSGAVPAPRPPLLFPATRWSLGAAAASPGHPVAGFVWDNEKWAHDVAVPGFEIDAQPVSWTQYAEFAADGGYDDPRWWSADGWQWLQREGRRVPRHVDQMRAGVLQRKFGAAVRVPATQPVVHVSAHEAEAWCRWAGRRLPTEVEWDMAAGTGTPRGWHWSTVREWTASTFRPYPGFAADPWGAFSAPSFGSHRVVRGASAATHPRLRQPGRRGFLPPGADHAFTGFRSCAA